MCHGQDGGALGHVDSDDLVELEQRFWRAAGGRPAYEQHLAADALHVLPGMGVVSRDDALAGVEAASPWESWTIDDPHVVKLADDASALVYTTRARRASAPAYRAAVTSVYRHTDAGWELVVHAQTPLGE